MKFLRCSIIRALDKTCFFFFHFFFGKYRSSDIHNFSYFYSTRVKQKRVCYESEGRWSRWSVFALHTNTIDRFEAAVGTEKNKSSGNVILSVSTKISYARSLICWLLHLKFPFQSKRMKFHQLIILWEFVLSNEHGRQYETRNEFIRCITVCLIIFVHCFLLLALVSAEHKL